MQMNTRNSERISGTDAAIAAIDACEEALGQRLDRLLNLELARQAGMRRARQRLCTWAVATACGCVLFGLFA